MILLSSGFFFAFAHSYQVLWFVVVVEIKSYMISFAFASNIAWQKWHCIACFCSSSGRIKIFVDIYWTASRCLSFRVKDSNASLKYNCPGKMWYRWFLMTSYHSFYVLKQEMFTLLLSSGQESWITEFFGFGSNMKT